MTIKKLGLFGIFLFSFAVYASEGEGHAVGEVVAAVGDFDGSADDANH